MANIFWSDATSSGIAPAGRLRAALPGEGTGLLWDSDLPAFQIIPPLAFQASALPQPMGGLTDWIVPQWLDETLPLPTSAITGMGIDVPAWTQPADLADASSFADLAPVQPLPPPSGPAAQATPHWPDEALPPPTGVIAVLGIEFTAWTQPAGLAEPWPVNTMPPAAQPMLNGNGAALPPRSPELPAPLFLAPVLEGGARADVTITEETDGVVHRPTVIDRVPDGLGWRITGGSDAALLMMDPASGALSFRSPPDFERPADADGDNAYDLVFEVRDGWGAAAMQRLTLLVTDQPEPSPAPDDIWG